MLSMLTDNSTQIMTEKGAKNLTTLIHESKSMTTFKTKRNTSEKISSDPLDHQVYTPSTF